jgi:DNA polymerase III delta subunit
MATVARGPAAPFFVFYGEEDFFLDRGIEVARHWPGRRVTTLDASEGLDDLSLVQELETNVMDAEPRTIIVDEAQKLKETKLKALRIYADEKAAGDTSVVLVAIVRSKDPNKPEKLSDLWSHIGAKGKITEHRRFKPWADKSGKSEYHKFIESEAKRVGLGLEDGVSDFIFQMTGDNLYRILNELRKLYLLVGNGNKVTKQHVASVIAVTPTAEPKDVIEASFAKNVKGAMNSLSLLYKSMGDEVSVRIVFGLMIEAQKLLMARYMLDKGSSEDDIAAAVGMHPFRCKVAFLPNVRRHSQKDLARLMRRLCKLDQDVKGPSRSKRTLVELTVLSIAG